MLRDRGFDVGDVAISPVNNRSRKDSILWMLRNGTPWFAKRSIDLFPGLIWLSMAEIVYLVRSRFLRTSKPLTQIQTQVVPSKAPVRTLVSH
jgi:hypothetical protein